MPSLSIVIRAYNEENHLGRLLEGIAHQTFHGRPFKDTETILVDSGSTDSTPDIAQRYGAQLVEIRPEDFSFGRSLNRGIAAASADIVVIASAHVYPVYPDWLVRLTAPFDDPQVAAAYGKQVGAATTKFSESQVFARWFPDVSVPRQTHPFCNNANAAVRRSLWQEHPYDETLTGLEDLAWAKWAIEQGKFVSYVAEAEVVHVHAERPSQVFNRYRREAMAFKQIYDEAHFSLYDFVRLTWANALADLFHAARARALAKNMGSILWFRTTQFWGTYRGYRDAQTPLTAPLRQTFYYPHGRMIEQGSAREAEPIQYNDLP